MSAVDVLALYAAVGTAPAPPVHCLEETYRLYLKQIISEEGLDDPIMLVDLQLLADQVQLWKKLLPRVQPFYAVKCNPDEVLLRVLHAVGCCFDVASKAEIDLVLSLSCAPSKIIYANPCKNISSIKYSKQQSVNLLVFDNLDELDKIANVYPEASLILRFRTDDSASQCPMSSKFGAPREMWEVLLRRAKERNVSVIGVSFHVGSGCGKLGAFAKALSAARQLFDLAESKFSIKMSVLDIGGGFPGRLPSNVNKTHITFHAIAEEIRAALDKFFSIDAFPNLNIIAEPGRYLAAPCHTLAVQISARRLPMNVRENEEGDEEDVDIMNKISYYINDGVYGSFNCVIYDHAVPEIEPLDKNTSENDTQHASVIFGNTCDGFDVVSRSTNLPKLQIGEWLMCKEMGAYTTCACSGFNGFDRPVVRYCRVGYTFDEPQQS
eukprot:GHVL01041652.1.p1 GENE.GHVL01041652.1~~GHVL01041652.1.p1  ORF type:complete len:437 (-),score=53.33 GHVL01041652.1:1221-2531(-)